MSTRRVVLGALPGGGFGLRVSLPGFDVIDDDPNDIHKFSFNSDWDDFLRVWQFGLASTPVNAQVSIPFPDLGYVPFVEARQVSDAIAYDDRPAVVSGREYTQAACDVTTNALRVTNYIAPGSVFYIVFKENCNL